jgi:2-methylisocitrate lyase-like PEP mutase family enzyme
MAGRTAAGRAASSPAIPPRPDAQRAAAPRSWVNGRTDLFLHADDKQAVAGEAIARMQALAEAGADSVYPVRIQDDDALITEVVGAVPVPVNCTAHPTRHDLGRFARLGVGRITYGPLLQAALTDAMTAMISDWA